MKQSKALASLLCLLALLTACGNKDDSESEHTQQPSQSEETTSVETSTSVSETSESEHIAPATAEKHSPKAIYQDLAGKSFTFTSGAGGWLTELVFDKAGDGSFTGQYHDSDMGTHSLYVNEFEGQFEIAEQLDDETYTMILQNLQVTSPTGMTEPQAGEGGMDIIYTEDPYGLEESENFQLFLPYKEADEVPDDFASWVDLDIVADSKIINRYAIYNVDKGYGFGENVTSD